ncbi:MAG: VanZ family protein [Bradyrhizobiaceae bacterium]|nr:VanZ family protein [Bradyrhizobiaceae bacterium]
MTTDRTSVALAAVRTAGVLAVVTIAVLSLVPGHLRPNVPIDHQHFMAYFITAVLLSCGYGNWNPVAIATPMALYALALEIAQKFVPGRHPAFADFAEGTAGAVVGVLFLRLAASLV